MFDHELAPELERRVILLCPGCRRSYRAQDWEDAIVSVEHGEITLERDGQESGRFRAGDLLSLAGLGLSAIYNSGREPAVLIAVRRNSKEIP